MCLAVPGQVIEWVVREQPFAAATIQFGGVRRLVNMACVPEAVRGDFVLVHAGIAITRIDPTEAARILQTIAELELTEAVEFDEVR